jgi:hypothetical protein
MKRLHPVFNMVKLTLAPPDPIPGRHAPPPPPPELIDGKEEYIVKKILDSMMFRRRLQYLVKWDGYGAAGNTWEYLENVKNALEKVADFHSALKFGPKTGKKPRPNRTRPHWDRKFSGPVKTATAVRSSVLGDF